MSLLKGLDPDNAETYLDTDLAGSLDVIDVHRHRGGSSGLLIDTFHAAQAAGDLLYATGGNSLTRLPIGTAGQALHVNAGATAPEWAAPGNAITSVRKTADEVVNNSTVLQDDNHLTVPVSANAAYGFTVWLSLVSVSGTPDIDVGFTFPAAGTLRWGGNRLAPDRITISDHISPSGTSMEMGLDNVPRQWTLHGILVTGANAGNLQLQWAQNLATAENTTIQANSWLSIWQM